MSDRMHDAENDRGLWIEYGQYGNGLWIDARKVATVRNIGKGGKPGSVITLDNGHEYGTGYPATQLVAMVLDARTTRVLPSATTEGDAQ